MGQVWEGTSPRWAGAPPLGLPLFLGQETLGVGAPPLAWGEATPLAAPPPPWRSHLGGGHKERQGRRTWGWP